MSTRERWIVYPLLFLTLGIAVRNYFLPTGRLAVGDLRAERISCGEMVVFGPNGRPAVIADASPDSVAGGHVITLDRLGRPTGFMGRTSISIQKRSAHETPPAQQPSEEEKPEQPPDDRKE
ncbi:MAG: hypothetical protein JW959_13550 [Pirellulales bacterium]|nr:hypothetical protein [Pirellulales bacterium]